MKQKEYPMDEDYNRALQFLADQIAERDQLSEQIKLLPPEARPEALRLLDELNKGIEAGEQALADEYEAAQQYHQALEERDIVFDDILESFAGAYVHAKYRHPDLLPKLDAEIKNMPPEYAKAFYERAAQLEAEDLIGIIAQQGETTEETEEFLRQYRAAEKEKQ